MAVCGSLPELGSWEKFICQLKWTEGNVWVTNSPITTTQYYFTYKYVVLKADGLTSSRWEAGIDRIADLEVLPHTLQEGGPDGV